jgi:hypothetical protein
MVTGGNGAGNEACHGPMIALERLVLPIELGRLIKKYSFSAVRNADRSVMGPVTFAQTCDIEAEVNGRSKLDRRRCEIENPAFDLSPTVMLTILVAVAAAVSSSSSCCCCSDASPRSRRSRRRRKGSANTRTDLGRRDKQNDLQLRCCVGIRFPSKNREAFPETKKS